jgi:diaminohydroxyphosphoribosylaminopyrimidine deaminase/5-amino-6-(5-phosphoribosylamino)uracil reductase
MDQHSSYSALMQRALVLAERGRGSVEPNPMVGAIVLDAVGQVVGEGWHQRFGEAHAEVHAFAQAGASARGGTLIVTLEPCCHWGKTPPCTEAVLQSGVRRVIVAMADPFPRVAGGGVRVLREAGLDVHVGLLEDEARQLNAPYLTLLQHQRPWVIAKWAMSLDGKIATHTGESQWISGEISRARVHQWRGEVDAILVGRGTLVADDPLLTARPPGRRMPTRIIVSRSGDLPADRKLLHTLAEAPVLVATANLSHPSLKPWRDAGAEVLAVTNLTDLLSELGTRRMTNVFVEGGSELLANFAEADLIDEYRVFVAPLVIGGTTAPGPLGGLGIARLQDARRFENLVPEGLGPDLLLTARRRIGS